MIFYFNLLISNDQFCRKVICQEHYKNSISTDIIVLFYNYCSVIIIVFFYLTLSDGYLHIHKGPNIECLMHFLKYF